LLQFRPKQTKELEADGTLDQLLDERTPSAWNILADCQRNVMHLHEAEEIALPLILVRSEKQDEKDEKDQQEQTDNP
jgi:hypothetical protein